MNRKISEYVNTIKIPQHDCMEYVVKLENDNDKIKFVDKTEKIIRQSLEYSDYIQYLKDNIGLDRCIFFQNIQRQRGSHKKITIELHHEPFTLFDIVYTVLCKNIDNGTPINDLDIADEVMNLHYENKVGLVPLSKTAHQMVHRSDKLFVPVNMCYGNYAAFYAEYDSYIPEEVRNRLEKKIEKTEKLTPEDFKAIAKEFTYLDMDGVEDIERIEVSSLMSA